MIIRRATESSPLDYRRLSAAKSTPMGFNKRKMGAQRAAAAEKEAAAKRATEAQVLEDAGRLVAAWNERQSKRMPMLFSPTIGCALKARHWFLWVCCPACRTTQAVDLRTLIVTPGPQSPASFQRCRAVPVGHTRRLPNSFAFPTRASPTNCTTNTPGGSLGNECRPNYFCLRLSIFDTLDRQAMGRCRQHTQDLRNLPPQQP
jgi:hypothetical protein